MHIVELDDLVAVGDGDCSALVERLATPPPGPATPADVVLHEPVGSYHEDTATVHLNERGYMTA